MEMKNRSVDREKLNAEELKFYVNSRTRGIKYRCEIAKGGEVTQQRHEM